MFIIYMLLSFSIGVLAQTTDNKIVAEHYQTTQFDAAIFPATSLDMIPGERFTPTHLEIQIAEAALRKDLEKLNTPLVNQHKSPIIHRKLKNFKRQYFGYLDSNNNKTLFINCFWKKSEHENWLNSQVTVLDGGSYFWNVKFDLKTSKLYDLYINGSG